jgi:hypothetical protein
MLARKPCPFPSPRHDPIPVRACYLLAHLHGPFPSLSIDFSCDPLTLPSCSYIAGCFRLVAQSAATCSRWFVARGFFYREGGVDTFLRKVGSHKIYTAPHPRRRHSSFLHKTYLPQRCPHKVWRTLGHRADGMYQSAVTSVKSCRKHSDQMCIWDRRNSDRTHLYPDTTHRKLRIVLKRKEFHLLGYNAVYVVGWKSTDISEKNFTTICRVEK